MLRPEDHQARLAFIGAGHMARALIRGFLAAGISATAIRATCRSAAHASAAGEALGVQVDTDNVAATRDATLVFLCVKPGAVLTVAREIAPSLADALVISVAAGVSLSALEGALPPKCRVIRSMPNTPTQIACGACAFARGRAAGNEDAATVTRFFGTVGIAEEVPEAALDAVTGLSGSGPAYVFAFLEALAEGGTRCGLEPALARQLALHTVLGAARLQAESGLPPQVLRDRVTSPGGTTAEGLRVLSEAGFADAIHGAVFASARRARELEGDAT